MRLEFYPDSSEYIFEHRDIESQSFLCISEFLKVKFNVSYGYASLFEASRLRHLIPDIMSASTEAGNTARLTHWRL